MQQRVLVVVCLVLAVAVSPSDGTALTPKGPSPFAQITQESQIKTCGDLLAYTVKTKKPACVKKGFAVAPSVVKVACTTMADCQKWCCSAVGLKVEAALVEFARKKASKASLSTEVQNYRLYCVNSKKKNPKVDCSKKPAGIDAVLEAAKKRPVMKTKDAWVNFEQREKHTRNKKKSIQTTKKSVAFVQLAERHGLRNAVHDDVWPAKTISYAYEDDVSEATVEEVVAAIKMLVDNTVLKFEKVDKDAKGHKIVFTENTDDDASSRIGCLYPSRPTASKVAKDKITDAENTRQEITFDPRAFPSKDGSTLAHELLHALGFDHMHQRADRDTYLDLANVLKGEDPDTGFDCDVNINNKEEVIVSGKYDYKSIMHYLGFNPTKNCQQNKDVDYRIKPQPKPSPDWPGPPTPNTYKVPGGAPIGTPSSGDEIGGATALSQGDIESVDGVYGSKPEF